jgi:phage terminase large subunit
MIQINPQLIPKQKLAMKYLLDSSTTEVLYGGAAGGGKSYIGCCYSIITCLKYPGIRGMIGRSKLDTLKKTTLNTLFDICHDWGIKAGEHFKYNGQANIITFYNNSEIILKDLYQYPADPNFDSLGSLELTFAFADEVSQLTEKAKQIVSSRLRYKLDEYNLIPKFLMTCNPSKGWVYQTFYKPAREGVLAPHRKFIQALVDDNRHISSHYRDQLKNLDEISKARLLRGDWEYDDSKDQLIDYDSIINMFSSVVPTGDKYITADIARFGKDKTCIMYWNGLQAAQIIVMDSSSMVEVADRIKEIQQREGVLLSNIIVDADGVGGGAADILRCKNFHNAGKPINGENYANLKTQCYFKLSELINKGQIGVSTNDIKFKEHLIQELEQVRRINIDKDSKLTILGKDKIRDLIGRSPDYSDTMMMRMYYELNPNSGKYYIH